MSVHLGRYVVRAKIITASPGLGGIRSEDASRDALANGEAISEGGTHEMSRLSARCAVERPRVLCAIVSCGSIINVNFQNSNVILRLMDVSTISLSLFSR